MKKIFLIGSIFIFVLLGIINASADIEYSATSGNLKYTITYNNQGGYSKITGVTSIADFSGEQVIPDTLGGYPVTGINSLAFQNCTDLISITIPDTVTNMGSNVFLNCTNLINIKIPASVESIVSSDFVGCKSLKCIDVDVNNQNYTSIEGVLYNKYQTELIKYPQGRADAEYSIPDGVETIKAWAFWGATALTRITIPDTVATIELQAFYGCVGIQTINVPNSVNIIGKGAFGGCTALSSITLPFIGEQRGISKTEKSVFGYIFGSVPSSLKFVTITDETKIPYGAFSNCKNLSEIKISGNVTEIDNYAFENCNNLKSITFPESLSTIGGYTFYRCQGLTNFVVPDHITAIGNGAFYGCNNLTSITVLESVTYIGEGAFYGCNNLTSITVPESVTYIGEGAFAECTKLKDVSIDNGITAIQKNTFSGCTELESITLPETVTDIDYYAFYNCDNLKDVVLPKNITSINDYAFKSDEKFIVPVVLYCEANDYVKQYAELKSLTYIDTSFYDLILTAPKKTKYYKGESLDLTGLKVYKQFENSAKRLLINEGYTVTGYNADLKGYQTVEIRYDERVATFKVLVHTGIVLSKKTTELLINNSEILTASLMVDDYSNDDIIWISSDENIVSVSGDGTIIAKSAGSAVITAKTIDGINYDTCTVDVICLTNTVTYKGDYSGVDTVVNKGDITLPMAPDGYVYKFTVDGENWCGTNISEDVIVTVTMLCDLAKMEITNLENGTIDDYVISGDFYDRTYVLESVISPNAYLKKYSDILCQSEIKDVFLDIGLNTFYVKVTAQSGRENVYTVNINRNIPKSLGTLTVLKTIGGDITFKTQIKIPGNPTVAIYYGNTYDNLNYYYLSDFNSDVQTISIYGLEENTEYYFMAVAEYQDFKTYSEITFERTGITLSSECRVLQTLMPSGGIITEGENGEPGSISNLRVTNKFDSITLDVTVSKGAIWELYRTATASVPIENKTIELNAGRNNVAFIRVTAEDGEHTNVYKISIYRQSKSTVPVISFADGMVTITATENSTILYTLDDTEPDEKSGIVYTGPFAAVNGTKISAIAKQADKDEYSDTVFFTIKNEEKIIVTPLDVYELKNGLYMYNFYIEAPFDNDRKFIIAFYSDGKMVGYDMQDISFIEGIATGKATVTATPDYYKAFIWDGLSSLKPLSVSCTNKIQ